MNSSYEPQNELRHKLRWLILSRVIFTILLLGSTIFIHISRSKPTSALPIFVLYGIIIALFILSFLFVFLVSRIRREVLFAYIQVAIDSVVVTLVIFVTGSFGSVFSFLYLVVIIYTSMLLYRRGSFIVAGLCSFLYFVLVGLEYQAWILPFDFSSTIYAMSARVQRVEKMAAVGEMGAGLAHEIKNPLASITGSIQLLREEIPYDVGRD